MKVPAQFDLLLRQLTPLILLGVLVVALAEPWLPGRSWLATTFGDGAVLRLCVAALVFYVLLLWGESLRLNALLTGVLKTFREHGSAEAGAARRNPKARLEAARLLVAALGSDDPEIRQTSRHNLQRLVGRDLGPEPGPWLQWLAAQEREA